MRRRGEGGYQLFKSNVKKLVDTIHAELQKKERGQAREPHICYMSVPPL